ncbi:hypothetical protein R5R35_004525 [Gryllus longicercus]|uniref:Uncharacterized protein n=1 Tax=Gryllus longicercus TaxID=2509291 RepID=A0AAN9W5W3_9ORTH
MPYIVVRGTLGMSNTKVYGLSSPEAERISSQLRPGPINEAKDELTFYNSAVFVMNQLEYFFGYRVISCACQGDAAQPVWTMVKPRNY